MINAVVAKVVCLDAAHTRLKAWGCVIPSGNGPGVLQARLVKRHR